VATAALRSERAVGMLRTVISIITSASRCLLKQHSRKVRLPGAALQGSPEQQAFPR